MALSRCGVQCRVVSFDGWRPKGRASGTARPTVESCEAGAPVLRVLSSAGLLEAQTFALAGSPDILHIHHGMLWDFAQTVATIGRVPAVKSVHVLQAESSRLLGLKGETLSLQSQNAALAGAEIVTVPSRGAAECLARDYPAYARKLRVIPFGIQDSPAALHSAAVHAYGPPGPVLYVGRFAEVKGTPDLFHAIPQVLARHPEVPFVVAGGIPDSRKMDNRWRRKLDALLPEPFRKHVRFTGWVSGDELALLYSAARVLVSPSRLETYGLAVLEAMLFGLPVVGTNTAGTSELVAHGETGLLSNPGDSGELADNLCELLGNVELCARMGKNGAEAVRKSRLWDRVISELVTVYRELLPGFE